MWYKVAVFGVLVLYSASRIDAIGLSPVCLHKVLQCIPRSNSTSQNVQTMCRSDSSQVKFEKQLDCTLEAVESTACRGDMLARSIGMGDMDAQRLQSAVDYLCSEMDAILQAIACVMQNQGPFDECTATVSEQYAKHLSDEDDNKLTKTVCRAVFGVFDCIDVKTLPSCSRLTSLRTFLHKLLPPKCDNAASTALSMGLIVASLLSILLW